MGSGQPADVARHSCSCSKGRVDARVQVSHATWRVAAWFAAGVALAILPGCVSQARPASVFSPSEHRPGPGGPPPAFCLLGVS